MYSSASIHVYTWRTRRFHQCFVSITSVWCVQTNSRLTAKCVCKLWVVYHYCELATEQSTSHHVFSRDQKLPTSCSVYCWRPYNFRINIQAPSYNLWWLTSHYCILLAANWKGISVTEVLSWLSLNGIVKRHAKMINMDRWWPGGQHGVNNGK